MQVTDQVATESSPRHDDDAVARALDIGPASSAAERTIDITTLGRRSGVPRRIEIWFHHVDGRWYLSGMPTRRSWYANVLAHPRFTVHLKHGVTADLPATAVPVDDDATRRRVITAVLDIQNLPEMAARGYSTPALRRMVRTQSAGRDRLRQRAIADGLRRAVRIVRTSGVGDAGSAFLSAQAESTTIPPRERVATPRLHAHASLHAAPEYSRT